MFCNVCGTKFEPSKRDVFVCDGGEKQFAKEFFAGRPYIHHPAVFRDDGFHYSPDFYDVERDVFIEVINTRQAYHGCANLNIERLKEHFPYLKFEVRFSNGELMDCSGDKIDWSGLSRARLSRFHQSPNTGGH